MSIDQRIREGLRTTNGVLPTPNIDRALAAVTAGGRSTRRRGLVGALAAAAAVLAVIGGMLAITGDTTDSQPIGPATPTQTTTDPTAPTNPMVNGRIQSTDEYLGRAGVACGACYWPGSAFDQRSGRLLLVDDKGAPGVEGIRVVGRDGLVARLTCPDDFACPQGQAMTLGPGADEFSVVAHPDEVQVVGLDGTVRHRIDLSAALDEDDNAYVASLAWSQDGERLAVQTGGSGHRRIWLVDDGRTELVYTASSTEELPRLAVSGTSWSPEGSRLGFVEDHWNMAAEFGRPESEIASSTRAVTILLPEPGQGATGVARTLYDYPKHPPADSGANYDAPVVFLWSPDGARVAIRNHDRVLVLSAEDGTVIAEHPFVGGLLIWPARQP